MQINHKRIIVSLAESEKFFSEKLSKPNRRKRKTARVNLKKRSRKSGFSTYLPRSGPHEIPVTSP